MNGREIVESCRSGIASIVAIADGFTDRDWATPACGSWTAGETVRHVLTVARWYDTWLDRAIAGDTTLPFPGDQIDAYTAAALDDVDHLRPTEALADFEAAATTHLDRAVSHWDLPFAYPFGVVTVGLHLGVAATEWHLHAWDLSGVRGDRHEPERPDALFISAGECVAAATGGMRGAMIRRVVPLVARRAPWETLLRRAGREG